MLRGTDPQTTRFLTGLAQITARLNEAQNQTVSGKRINKVSDAPDEISRLLQVRSELNSTEQTQSNLNRLKGEVDCGEQALQHAVSLMDRVATLGTQGGTDTLGAEERLALSQEAGSILQQLTGVAATTMDGRYIFSGDSDQHAPYDVDLRLDDPFSAYQGSASTRQALHPSGRRFDVALSADQIFDNANPGASVFQAVNQLRLALRENDSQAIRSATADVQSASTHLNNELAFYGSVQNQVAEATDYGEQQKLTLQQQISDIQDADMTSAILELKQMQVEQQTALATEASRTHTSLFDFLK